MRDENKIQDTIQASVLLTNLHHIATHFHYPILSPLYLSTNRLRLHIQPLIKKKKILETESKREREIHAYTHAYILKKRDRPRQNSCKTYRYIETASDGNRETEKETSNLLRCVCVWVGVGACRWYVYEHTEKENNIHQENTTVE